MPLVGCTLLLFADNTVAPLVRASADIDRNDTTMVFMVIRGWGGTCAVAAPSIKSWRLVFRFTAHSINVAISSVPTFFILEIKWNNVTDLYTTAVVRLMARDFAVALCFVGLVRSDGKTVCCGSLLRKDCCTWTSQRWPVTDAPVAVDALLFSMVWLSPSLKSTNPYVLRAMFVNSTHCDRGRDLRQTTFLGSWLVVISAV